jgi:putative DNA primase/helicase
LEKQSNDARKPKKQHSAPARNWVGDNGKIIEPLFADYFLNLHPMRCFQGRLFTVDGMVEDEAPLKKEIYEQIRYYATTSVARRIEHIMQAIKLACASEPPEIQTDRIHVRNGTYFADGHFTPEKEYCMNRLPIAYVSDAPAPTRWLQFLNELLYEDDIPALQEYIGYCLLPVTKAQKMLLMVGKGGEGKSRIGLILRELFGSSMYTGSLQKVETNRFARADLEYKLLLVDDDMKTEALPQTNNIKTLVTLEEIAQMLSISLRSAYNLCNSTTEFRVLRVGGSIRIPKDSFDAWLRAA